MLDEPLLRRSTSHKRPRSYARISNTKGQCVALSKTMRALRSCSGGRTNRNGRSTKGNKFCKEDQYSLQRTRGARSLALLLRRHWRGKTNNSTKCGSYDSLQELSACWYILQGMATRPQRCKSSAGCG
ncbi:hypothetical protein DOTSEDRAFT_74143 [Dothistroma septosporum NZE10]|uniref:Uncharacterized protein n=1 Tax=Dothistroma septosporum (strain NZE10 / CBS 128990) TaxID=675120 RepID=N1PD07_DOTSN|nr:hypothetical protein DOTSEDRAFT_74143 [Dothistroma septosporum NZE10]